MVSLWHVSPISQEHSYDGCRVPTDTEGINEVKRKRYTAEQIRTILQEIEAGRRVGDVCRKYGVSEQSVYRWKHRFGQASTSDGPRVRELEEENARLRRIVAQQLIDVDALQERLSRVQIWSGQ